MKKKIKHYKVSPSESMGLAFSVVDRPAVESEFQFFSEDKIEKFVAHDGERRMIYGCALRPEFPIYRNNGSEEYYLEFDADSIDKISKNYFKMGFQGSWTEAHKDEVEGLTITESWIKESMTQDKSVALGLDPSLPIGSWFIGCYCENDDIWNQVKEGKYHGFSIEAIVGVEEFESQINNNDKNNETMTNEEMFSKIKELFKEVFSKKEDIEPVAIEDLEEQTPQEPQETPQESVEEPQPTEQPQEPQNEVTEQPTDAANATQNPTDSEEAPKATADTKHLEDLIESMKGEIEALKSLNSELKGKVKNLEKQPSAKPISTVAAKGGSDTYSAWREQMRNML